MPSPLKVRVPFNAGVTTVTVIGSPSGSEKNGERSKPAANTSSSTVKLASRATGASFTGAIVTETT